MPLLLHQFHERGRAVYGEAWDVAPNGGLSLSEIFSIPSEDMAQLQEEARQIVTARQEGTHMLSALCVRAVCHAVHGVRSLQRSAGMTCCAAISSPRLGRSLHLAAQLQRCKVTTHCETRACSAMCAHVCGAVTLWHVPLAHRSTAAVGVDKGWRCVGTGQRYGEWRRRRGCWRGHEHDAACWERASAARAAACRAQAQPRRLAADSLIARKQRRQFCVVCTAHAEYRCQHVHSLQLRQAHG
jgi:hypothetical protein